MSLEIGRKLGPYEIVAPLGAGGMGEVYRARDGKQVLFSRSEAETKLDLWALTIGDDSATAPVLSGPFDEYQAEFSPDGRWLAYASDESGELQVHVLNWPDLTEKWQASTNGGGMPR